MLMSLWQPGAQVRAQHARRGSQCEASRVEFLESFRNIVFAFHFWRLDGRGDHLLLTEPEIGEDPSARGNFRDLLEARIFW